MGKFINIVGKRVGSLVVVKEYGRNKFGRIHWICKCDCGKTITVDGGNLRRGHTKSCGCGSYKNRYEKKCSKEHKTWSHLKERCLNKNCVDYKNYGGRGIKVCKRWLKFENFFEDMGKRPPGLTLDRVDNNGNYCKKNCRWATSKQQNNNRRDNHIINIDGVKRTLSQWADCSGTNQRTILTRLRRGWDTYRAVFQPPIKGGSHDEIHNHRETNG